MDTRLCSKKRLLKLFNLGKSHCVYQRRSLPVSTGQSTLPTQEHLETCIGDLALVQITTDEKSVCGDLSPAPRTTNWKIFEIIQT